MSGCIVCHDGEPYYAYQQLIGLSVCSRCAEVIANAYAKAHSGRWLTWPEDPQAPVGFQKAKIPHELRKAVYERDKYRCVECDTHIDLTLDHIHPESKGGETTEANLRTLCRSCNCRKGAR